MNEIFVLVKQTRFVVTDAAAQHIGRIFRGQVAFLECLALTDGTDEL